MSPYPQLREFSVMALFFPQYGFSAPHSPSLFSLVHYARSSIRRLLSHRLVHHRTHLLNTDKTDQHQPVLCKYSIQTGFLGNESDIVEELAREYGMTKEGELIFKFKD